MGCVASSTVAAAVDPLLLLLSPKSTIVDGVDGNIKFSFGPTYEKLTKQTVSIPISISITHESDGTAGSGLSLFMDFSSRGIVLRKQQQQRKGTNTGEDDKMIIIAVCKKVGTQLNIYRLEPCYPKQRPNPHVTPNNGVVSSSKKHHLYKYGTMMVANNIFTYNAKNKLSGSGDQYHVTDKKKVLNREGMYECYIKKHSADSGSNKPKSLAKWVYDPSDKFNYVKIFGSHWNDNDDGDEDDATTQDDGIGTEANAEEDEKAIDIGLLLCLIGMVDYQQSIINNKKVNFDNLSFSSNMNMLANKTSI